VITAITAHIQNKGSGIKESDITLTGVKLLAFQTSKNGYASLMITLDLNADIGEAEDADGIASELSILKYVSSANIACGGHRGDAQSMRRTVTAALRHKVQIGAHPAYPDRQNFGRKSMQLETAYVKPHGALYNDSVNSTAHANLIAAVIADFKLGFMGAPNSEMGRAAERHNLRFISEGFIDRRYTDDGHLQSRAIKGAVIASIDMRLEQAKSLAVERRVQTSSGKWLNLNCESLCLHGDSAGAVDTARLTRQSIEALGVTIKAFGSEHA